MVEERKNNDKKEAYKYYSKQLEHAKKWFKPFLARGSNAIRVYRGEDGITCVKDNNIQGDRYSNSFNILYSNTDTLKPVLFSEVPLVNVKAVNTKDTMMRQSAEMIEQTLQHCVDQDDFKSEISSSVQDYLLSGMGTCRVVYEPTITKEENGEEELQYEEVKIEYVAWDDLLFSPAASWKDVKWVAFRKLMNICDVKDKWGEAVADSINFSLVVDEAHVISDDEQQEINESKAEIWEIWDETKRQRIFYALNRDNEVIEIDDDPLELSGFFPIPKPLFSIQTGDSLLPIPFFDQYELQAYELAEVSERISKLTSVLRYKGIYDKAINNGALSQLSSAKDGTFIPVENFQRLVERGGLKAVFDSEDITPIANVLQQLYQQRDQIINVIYQIVGISDIMRGATDPREALGTQRMKGGFGKLRVSDKQRLIQKYIKDLIQIKGEIIINNFSPETLSVITGIGLEDNISIDPQTGQPFIESLGTKSLQAQVANQNPSSVVIDIETDSTVAHDEVMEQEKQVAFTSLMTEFAAQAPTLQSIYGTQVTSEMLKGIVQRFNLGRTIEQALDDRIEEAILQEQQASQQPPEPTEAEIQAQTKQMEVQLESQKLQLQAQIEFAKIQQKERELELKEQELIVNAGEKGAKVDIDQQKVDLESLKTAISLQATQGELANPNDNAFVGV